MKMRVTQLLDSLRLELPADKIIMNGDDITGLIRTPEITAASGAIASSPVVRRRLVDWQRLLASGRNVVCEGRDQGTIVFPAAECKFFLVADPKERAGRRQREMQSRGQNLEFDEVLQAQEARDRRDLERVIAPMVPAADAIELDSTGLTIQQVVERMEAVVRQRSV